MVNSDRVILVGPLGSDPYKARRAVIDQLQKILERVSPCLKLPVMAVVVQAVGMLFPVSPLARAYGGAKPLGCKKPLTCLRPHNRGPPISAA